MMTYEVALRHPEVLRGIAALSGRLLPVVRTQVLAPSSYRGLSVFIGHGTADPQVPYAGATEALSYLQTLSIEPAFHSYPGVVHTISGNEVTDLANWKQRTLLRPSSPRSPQALVFRGTCARGRGQISQWPDKSRPSCPQTPREKR